MFTKLLHLCCILIAGKNYTYIMVYMCQAHIEPSMNVWTPDLFCLENVSVVIKKQPTFAAALIIAGPPISIFSIPSSNSIPPIEVTLS